MPIGVSKQIFVAKQTANIDPLKGPFSSVEEALKTVTKSYRSQGREVYVILENGVKTFIWKRGIEDEDLVPKFEDNMSSIIEEYPIYNSLQEARTAIGEGKIFRYSSSNIDGVTSPNSSITAKT